MSKQAVAVCLILVAVVGAPFLASALWRHGLPRPVGYLAGFALLLAAALWLGHVGGFPGRNATN